MYIHIKNNILNCVDLQLHVLTVLRTKIMLICYDCHAMSIIIILFTITFPPVQIQYVTNLHFDSEQIFTDTPANISFRISKHYLFSLETVFMKFPNAKKMIIIEEDLLVSPDFFR